MCSYPLLSGYVTAMNCSTTPSPAVMDQNLCCHEPEHTVPWAVYTNCFVEWWESWPGALGLKVCITPLPGNFSHSDSIQWQKSPFSFGFPEVSWWVVYICIMHQPGRFLRTKKHSLFYVLSTFLQLRYSAVAAKICYVNQYSHSALSAHADRLEISSLLKCLGFFSSTKIWWVITIGLMQQWYCYLDFVYLEITLPWVYRPLSVKSQIWNWALYSQT